MADNPVFADEEDIPLIDYEDNDYEESQYDTPDMCRIEETFLTTEHPTVRLRERVLRDHIIDLYRYLDVGARNIYLVNTDLFKVKKSKSGAGELRFF